MTIGLSSGLYIAHVFIPPTPGPVLVATMLNVELGWVILVGVCCGFFAMIVAGPVWGAVCGKKFYVPVPDQIANQKDIDESKLPSFASVVTIIMIPLVLIILKSVAGVVPALAGVALFRTAVCRTSDRNISRNVHPWNKAWIHDAGIREDPHKIFRADRTDPSCDSMWWCTSLYFTVLRLR